MILSKAQYNEMYGKYDAKKNKKKGSLRTGVIDENARWDNGVMPYTFDSKFNWKERQIIKKKIQEFNREMKGCLELR